MIRIALWSGPRNISTAMMRSWGNRPDTVVIDEPFYAFYLKATGKKHPGAAEVIANGETDWRKVVKQLTGQCERGLSARKGKKILFQKQMTHHLLPEIDRKWIADMTNCFLIRDPREVILSYIKKNPEPTLEDLGYVQQQKIFEFVRENQMVGTPRSGVPSRSGVRGQRSALSLPPVIDTKDVLQNPERMLRMLCQAVEVEFSDAMLSWPPGLRETDGIWAKYWYDEVARSTSFQPYKPREGLAPDRLRETYEQCRECYERLYEYRLH